METSRKDHLAWAKQRALELLEAGDLRQAFMSMTSDLNKHDGTRNSDTAKLGFQLLEAGHLDSPIKMREWIEGFN